MTKTKVNRIAFAIDTSSSMQGIIKDAIRAFNSNIETIKEQVKATGQDATVSLYTFDDDVKTVFFNRSIDSVKPLGENSLKPYGMTALFDAAEQCISQLEQLPVGADEDASYLINVITDGGENRSKPNSEVAGNRLKKLMNKVISTDLWTTAFLVPPANGRDILERFGVPEGNIMEWNPSKAGVEKYSAANNAGIARYFGARASGQSSIKSFYTNLRDVSIKEVRQLNDLTKSAMVLDVKGNDPKTRKPWEIKNFIEAQGLRFNKGCAFYELIPGKKTADKVQDYKKVLIMQKGKSDVYGGDDARQLLGLPDRMTKIRPGDHGNFILFIQSTSLNRALKDGTRVIYMPSAAI